MRSRSWLLFWTLSLLANFEAARAIVVRGTAESTGGAALADARVELTPLAGNFERARLFLDGRTATEPAASARADEQGRFDLDAPSAGLFTVTIRAQGFVPLELAPLALTEPHELPPARLAPDAGTRVRVGGSDGEAIAGAWVFASRAGRRSAEGWSPALRLVRTGGDGVAVLPRADGERLDVALYVADRAHLAERRGVARAAFTVPAAPRERRRLEVRGAGGEPLAGVIVTLGDFAWTAGTTDEEGVLTIPAPRTPVRVGLLSSDGRRLRATLGDRPLRLTLSAPARAAGRVLRQADRRPVARALVWPAFDPGAFTLSDDEGRYVLTLPDRDGREMQVAAAGFQGARVGVEDAGTEILLATSRPARGRVIDPDERPIAGVEVVLRPVQSRDVGRPPAAVLAATGADGRFAVAHLPAERLDVLARRRGYAPTLARGVRGAAGPASGAAPTATAPPPVDLGTLVLVPGASIAGQVLDGAGEGIPGVGVWLSTRLDRPAAELLSEEPGTRPAAVTDREGRFAVEDLEPGGRFHLLFRGDGYLPAALEAVPAPPENHLAVVLERAARVRGRVTDEAGLGVAGAAVTLHPPAKAGQLELPRQGREHRHETFTEHDGTFAFDAVAAGRYEVAADAEGYLAPEPRSLMVPAGGPATPVTFLLEWGAALRGRVTTSDGLPVAGARVSAGGALGISDEDGRYLAAGVPTGPTEVLVRHPVLARIVEEVDVDEGENVHDFVLAPGHPVGGQVVDGDGTPVPGARVELEQQSWEDRHHLAALTDEAGRFRLPEVAAGRYLVRASKAGHAWVERPEAVEVAGPVEDLEVALPPGVVVHGFVHGLDPGELAAIEIGAERPGAPPRAGTVDYEGAFEVTDLGPGDWLLRAWTPGREREARLRLVVEPGARRLERHLEFGDGFDLGGRVLFGEDPLAGARVSLTGHDLALRRQVLADHEGVFGFRDLPRGSYRLSAFHPRQLLVSNEDVTVPDAGQITLRLEGAKVHGEVSATAGMPLAGAQVSLQQITASGQDGSLYSLPTSADGTFALPQLTAGRYRVTVRHDGYEQVDDHVELVAGTTTGPLRYELEHTTGLELRVTAEGVLPSHVTVAVSRGAGRPLLVESRSVDAGGRVSFPTVPAGTWDLRISAPGAAVQERTSTVPGEPLPVTLAPAGRLRLRVPDLVESDRIAVLRLLNDRGEPLLAVGESGLAERAWALAGGAVDVDGVPSGWWTLMVETPDGQTWTGRVATADRGSVEVLLDGGRSSSETGGRR